MDDLACPACRGTDLIRLGLGRQRRCRKCGRVWIATELPTAPVQAHAKGTTSRSSSSRTSAGLAGLATLRDLPLAAQVRAALGRYLEVALPNHRSDEGDAWTFRALPSTKATKYRRRLFTVNVSNMEALVAHYDPTTGKDTGGFLVVQPEGPQDALREILRSREVYAAPYATAGDGALVTVFDDFGDLMTMLSLPLVQRSAQLLNDRLRSTAQVPSLQRQWHVPQFVEWVVGGERTDAPT